MKMRKERGSLLSPPPAKYRRQYAHRGFVGINQVMMSDIYLNVFVGDKGVLGC
jgi:hypothetical protein